MIKNKIKYLLLSVIGFIVFTSNVNAGCTHPGSNGILSWTCDGDQFHFNINGRDAYCIDAGYAIPNMRSCTAVPIHNDVGASLGGNYLANRSALRAGAKQSGLNQTIKGGHAEAYSGNGFDISAEGMVSLTEGTVSYSGNTANVEIIVSAPAAATLTATGGTLSTTTVPAGETTVTLSVPVSTDKAKCPKSTATVTAKSTGGTVTNSGTDWYYIYCNGGKQNFIAQIPAGVPWDENYPQPDAVGKLEVKVVPEGCGDCKGTTSLCTGCDDGESSDNKENRLSCANTGGFKDYCGADLQKTTDTNASVKTTTATHGPSVSPSLYLSENPYCNVYCVEKIEYHVPGHLKTQGGRYFKLRKDYDLLANNEETSPGTSIKGTRTCITSEIDISKYSDNIEAAQRAVLETWNNLREAQAKYDGFVNGGIKTETVTQPNGTETYEYNTVDAKGKTKKATGTRAKNCTYTRYYYTAEEYTKYTATFSGIEKSATIRPEKVGKQDIDVGIVNGDCPNLTTTYTEGFKVEKPTWGGVKGALQAMYKVINQYKSCFEWNNNYCFEPTAHFWYDESYNDEMEGDLPRTKLSVGVGGQAENYTNNPGADYSGTGSKNGITATYVYAKDNKDYIPDNSNESKDLDVTNHYVKKEVIGEAEFGDATKQVYSYAPYGTITTNKANCTKENNCKDLGYVLPVQLEHNDPDRVYNYYIEFDNVGVGGNDSTCSQPGRINGNKCSLTNVESNGKCNGVNGANFICNYSVTNCPGCEIECKCPDNSENCYVEDKVCKWEKNNCPECKIECIGCLWHNGDTTISFKPISVDKVFEADEKKGTNWTEDKIKEIEDKGQTIYKTASYKFRLTPSTMSKIRDYNSKSVAGNDQNIPKGGYNSDTLDCSGTEKVYYCTSSFFRYLDSIDKNAIQESENAKNLPKSN